MTSPQHPGSGQFIHYNPERTDYSLTPDELARLESAGSNLWKDVCLVSTSLGVPCFINAVAGTPDPFKLSVALFLNYLIGALGLALAVIFGFAWLRTHKAFGTIVSEIKKKPKMQLFPSLTDVGAMQGVSVQPATNGPQSDHPVDVLTAEESRR